ncbi:MAG: type II restriction endonuclease [Pyrinomonadaceae bacterium]|nr:type II restriction endonuclease [Pyrinomonadaceae bacterium]
MNLSSVFTDVAHKQLVAVDLPGGSNQHELNGIEALKQFFGTGEPTHGTLSWHYFADDHEPAQDEGHFTFYDARAKSAGRTGRTEWRFYYYGQFLAKANVGDWFFLARSQSGRLFALVFQSDSGWLRAAQTLFGVQTSAASFDAIRAETLHSQELELLRRQIIGELDLEVALPVLPTDEELMLAKYGRTFPKTREMAIFARTQVEVDITRPDEALVAWLDREEQLFRALESVVIGERLATGFRTVDEFIEYSLSVQNRRKSRMGFALQNHLSEVFTRQGLRFTPQARTEGNNRPDFIFPGQKEYHKATFDTSLLVMLGVKSTSKDRWRQVLTEADRIPRKHLCTLESGISTKQTEEMARQQLALVIPATLHATYTTDQREKLLSVSEFVEFVRQKQDY